MIYAYLIYGLSFFILWTVLWVYHIKIGRLPVAKNLWMIALFAIFHGIGDWIHMIISVQHFGSLFFRTGSLVFVIISFYFLIQFGISGILDLYPGRRRPILAVTIFFLVLVLITIGMAGSLRTAEVLARYFLCTPGSLLACYSLFLQRQSFSDDKYFALRRYLSAAAIGFAVYGFLSGLIVPEGVFFPASLLNYTSFSRAVEIPVELFRAAAVFAITYALTRVLQIFEQESEATLRLTREELEKKVAERTQELTRLDEALREHDRRQKAILDSIPDMAWLKDGEGRFVAMNEAFAKAAGKREEDLIGKTDLDIWPVELAEKYMADDREVIRSGKLKRVEEPFSGKEGRVSWIETIKAPIYGEKGRIAGTTGIARDISKRKEAEQELKDSEERYRVIAENAMDAIITIDEDSRIIFVNSSAERVFGYRSDELTGSPLTMLMPERFRQHHLDALRELIATGKSHLPWSGTQFPGLHRDGREIPLEMTYGRFKKEGNHFFTGIVRDISERKQIEEELQDRARELELAYKDLESFSYAVSHDLKAPAIRIEGFSNILLQDYGGNLDDYGRDVLQRVKDNSEHMRNLIQDLLAFFKFGGKKVEKTITDMAALAQSVFKELETDVAGREVRFEIQDPPPAFCDPAMMQQVLSNLLSNAIKFTRARETAVIQVGGKTGGDENVYYVKDNGIGFDMQFYSKLFGLFQRIHTSKIFEGTGVGLVIVKKIIETHGGRVWAEGAPDKGAIFYFSLPAARR